MMTTWPRGMLSCPGWNKPKPLPSNCWRNWTKKNWHERRNLPFWDDERASVTVAEGLLQVCNHATDHRAQTLAAIHSHGGETVEQDLLIYAFELRGLPWGWGG